MMKPFTNFLSSGVGLLVLGFLLTTGGGTLLNHFIQDSRFTNERRFEMYKTRLEEAKGLQKALLEASTARVFYLEQLIGKLGNPDQIPEDTKQFWQERYREVKDNWNKNLVYWQAQMRVLFSEDLHHFLVNDDENRMMVHDIVKPYLNEEEYHQHLPKTAHGAFVNTHATVYHLVFKCQARKHCKDWDDLLKLAEKQMGHLKMLHSCLSTYIAGELLVDPYGPHKSFVMPDRCQRARAVSAQVTPDASSMDLRVRLERAAD
jgi:hypothetical protein